MPRKKESTEYFEDISKKVDAGRFGSMDDTEWRAFLQSCRQVLGLGAWHSWMSESWRAYTTFASLYHGIHYWSCGFPEESDLLDSKTLDGGLWRQSFKYSDLAHVVVPATFYWERVENSKITNGIKRQDLNFLSHELDSKRIKYRKTPLVLELKLY